jgi:hypothetical protein
MSDVEAFLKNTWGDKLERKETLSGSGSTMANTQNIRRELPQLIKKYSVTSMFDAPCGDGNWISNVELNCSYVGGDLVSSFVSSAKRKELNVYDFDIRVNPFPPVDLWLCRACLYHLPWSHIRQALDNFISSDIPLALITSHVGTGESTDIKPGEFRRINFAEWDNFGLGEPIDRFVDVEHGPRYGNMTEEMLLFRNPRLD